MTNLLVVVRDGNVEGALRQLRKLMSTTGLVKDIKRRSSHEQPSQAKRRKSKEARKKLNKAKKRVAVAVEERERHGIST